MLWRVLWLLWVMWVLWVLGILGAQGVSAQCDGFCDTNTAYAYTCHPTTRRPICTTCAHSTTDPLLTCRGRNNAPAPDVCTLRSTVYNSDSCASLKTAVVGKKSATNCGGTPSINNIYPDKGCTTCGEIARTWCGQNGWRLRDCLYSDRESVSLQGDMCAPCSTIAEADLRSGEYLVSCNANGDGLARFKPCSSISDSGYTYTQCGNRRYNVAGRIGEGPRTACISPEIAPPPGQFLRYCQTYELVYSPCETNGILCNAGSFQVLCGTNPTLARANTWRMSVTGFPGQYTDDRASNEYAGTCASCSEWAITKCPTPGQVLYGCGGASRNVPVDRSTWEGPASGSCLTCAALNSSYCNTQFTTAHGLPTTGFYFTNCNIKNAGYTGNNLLNCELCNTSKCALGETLQTCGGESNGTCTSCELPTYLKTSTSLTTSPTPNIRFLADVTCDWACNSGWTGVSCSDSCTDSSPASTMGCTQNQWVEPCSPPVPTRCSTCPNHVPEGAIITGRYAENRILHGNFDSILLFDKRQNSATPQTSIRVSTAGPRSHFENMLDDIDDRPRSSADVFAWSCASSTAAINKDHSLRRGHACRQGEPGAAQRRFIGVTLDGSFTSFVSFRTGFIELSQRYCLNGWARMGDNAPNTTVTFQTRLDGFPDQMISVPSVPLSAQRWSYIRVCNTENPVGTTTATANGVYLLELRMSAPSIPTGQSRDVMLDDLVYSLVMSSVTYVSSFLIGGWDASTTSTNTGTINSAVRAVESGVVYSPSFSASPHDKNGDSVSINSIGIDSSIGSWVLRINSRSVLPFSGIKMSTTSSTMNVVRNMPWAALEFMAICFSPVNGNCLVTVYTVDKLRVEHRQTLAFDRVWVPIQVTFNTVKAYNDAVARGTGTAVVTIEATTGDIILDNIQFRELTNGCVWSCGDEGIRDGDVCKPCLKATAICTPEVSTYAELCSVDGYTRTPLCTACSNAPASNAKYVRNDDEDCYWVCNDGYYHKIKENVVDEQTVESSLECVPCNTGILCAVGQFATQCISTTNDDIEGTHRVATETASDSYCTSCTNLASIPDPVTSGNSRYVTPGSAIGKDDCVFECNAGFYSIGSRCITCTDTETLQCDQLSGFWRTVACTATSDAKCEPCPSLIAGRVYVNSGEEECLSRCAPKTYPCTTCAPESSEWHGPDTINVIGQLIDHSVFSIGSTEQRSDAVNIPGNFKTSANIQVILSAMLFWNELYVPETQQRGDAIWSILDTANMEWQYWFACRWPNSWFAIDFFLNLAGDIYFVFDAISKEQHVTLTISQNSVKIHEERVTFESNTKIRGYTFKIAMAQRAQYRFLFDLTERTVESSEIQEFALVSPILFVTPRNMQGITVNQTVSSYRDPCIVCQDSDGRLCLPCDDIDIPENAVVRHFTNPETLEPGCTWQCVGDFVLNELETGCRFCPFTRCSVGEYMSDCETCLPCDLSWVNGSIRDDVVFTSAGLTRFQDDCRVGCKPGLFQVDTGQDTGTGLRFVCVQCSAPACNVTQFLLQCTQFSDAVCIDCSTCGPGEQKESDCTDTSNTMCKPCEESLPEGARWRTGCEWECTPDSRGTRVPEIASSVFNAERGVCQTCVAECAVGKYSTNCSTENGFSGCEPCDIPEHAFATGAGQLTNNSCPWLCLPWADIFFTGNETMCVPKDEAPPPVPECIAECDPGWWVDPQRVDSSECECTECPDGKPNGTLTVWVGYPVTLTPCEWLCVPPYAKSTDGSHCVALLGLDSILRLSGVATGERRSPAIINETNSALVDSETTLTWVPPVAILLIVILVLCLSRVTRRRSRMDTHNDDEELALR